MSDAAQWVGHTLGGRYHLRRLIALGGMGAIFEGEHLDIGKRVAVKLLTERAAEGDDVESRLRQEARAASAVDSDHIVDVYDVGRDPQAGLFMVMEFLVGEDLEGRLTRETRLDLGTAVIVASHMARGLSKAHAAGVVHRDLKPANVFLVSRDDGSLLVKVLDFGISKLLNEGKSGPSQKLTRVGTVVGTAQYMAPEQAQGLASVDHRVDIWALGAVLYEALAGRPAYAELETYEQTIIQIVTTSPPQLTDVAPWVPHALASVVHAALRHDPEQRPRDCGVFLRMLLESVPDLLPDASGRVSAVSDSRASAVAAASGHFAAPPQVAPAAGSHPGYESTTGPVAYASPGPQPQPQASYGSGAHAPYGSVGSQPSYGAAPSHPGYANAGSSPGYGGAPGPAPGYPQQQPAPGYGPPPGYGTPPAGYAAPQQTAVVEQARPEEAPRRSRARSEGGGNRGPVRRSRTGSTAVMDPRPIPQSTKTTTGSAVVMGKPMRRAQETLTDGDVVDIPGVGGKGRGLRIGAAILVIAAAGIIAARTLATSHGPDTAVAHADTAAKGGPASAGGSAGLATAATALPSATAASAAPSASATPEVAPSASASASAAPSVTAPPRHRAARPADVSGEDRFGGVNVSEQY